MVRVAGESSRTAKYLNLSRAGADDPVIICYEAAGDGTPILCVPGLGDTGWVWRKIIPTLTSMHRVVAMEPRGHGRSSNPKGKYTLADLVGDVGGIIARLGLNRPVLIGHGLGARAALMLAIERPRLPGALILISTGAAPAAKSVRRGVAERIHLAEAGEMHEVYRNRKSEGREPRGMTPKERAEHHRLFLRNDASGYASAGYAELLAPDLTERLNEVSCPALALTGEEDPEYHEDARTLSAGIRDCESFLIEGAGRYAQLDRSEAVLALIHDFFRKHHLSVAKSPEENHEPID
ncbi:MAG: alpha/beta hydrolase [Nitrospinae bacterium]|nr:alpha/beta hydrolase [Nitrospinota bacterium]